jgi:RHS repeat-associated protein
MTPTERALVQRNANASGTYGAYGQRAPSGQSARSGYTGACIEPETGHYLLGDRLYSPVLRRFLNPDPVSPFDEGGLNRYAYCSGDPVNRVDPGGNAPWNWLFAGLGQPRTGISGAGSMGSPAMAGAGQAGPAAPASTPGSVTITAASRLDVVAVTTEIRSVASSAVHTKAGNVLGWLTAGSNVPAVGSSLSMKAPSDTPRYHVDVIGADQTPMSRFRLSNRRGALTLNTRWIKRVDPLDARISHWAPDTSVTHRKIDHPLKRLGRKPIVEGNKDVYLYTGVHGAVNGDNWENGKRARGAEGFYEDDYRARKRLAKYLPGRELHVENIAGISTDDMIEKMSRPGVHVHVYCFGAVDHLLLAVLGADPVPVYLRAA